MPSSKPPKVEDPSITAGKQQGLNKEAYDYTQGGNAMDQGTSEGTLDYSYYIDPVTGQRRQVANTNLNPINQMLWNLQRGTQAITGGTGANLAFNSMDQYSQPADLIGGANSLTQQAIDKMDPAWERFMAPERSQLDAQLRNQGILPGTPAYQQQVDALTNQQLLTKGNWATNFTKDAFNMANSEYQMPMHILSQLLSMSGPGNVKDSLVSTPTSTMGSADLVGATKNAQDAQMKAWEAKQAQQAALMKGIFGTASAAVGMPI
jgi:hypothetical protein